MESLKSFIELGYQVFSAYDKPAQYIDHQNDPEYRDYENSLEGIDRNSLEMKHIGHISWGPLLALSSTAFAYFLPKLIDFAVNGDNDTAGDPFIILFVSVVSSETETQQLELLGSDQRLFLLRTFFLLKGLYYDTFKEYCYEEELDYVIGALET
jgi:hypothetical protein